MTSNITQKHFITGIQLIAFLFASIFFLLSCSRSTDVSFMGKSLKSPEKEFVKHLEDKGFSYDGSAYKGKYLNEDVFIILSDDINGHYNMMIVSAVFSNPQAAKDYYDKACKAIAKEHRGFEAKDDNSFGTIGKDFINKDGQSIKITMASESIMAMVVTTYNVNDTDNEENLISSTKADTMTFSVNGVSFNMVKVDGGVFKMGGTEEQGDEVEENELPIHNVTVASFLIGQTEVTQDLWESVMGSNPSDNKHRYHPVENISWYDCIVFLKKLNALTHQNFRIPTEAEWEYAARGGKISKGYKYSGSNNLDEVAWNSNNSSSTHAVATKKANELGLFDMSGNVYEYCSDWYDETSYQTGEPKASLDENHVIRGGNYRGNTTTCRVSSRSFSPSPQFGEHILGIRLALSTAN